MTESILATKLYIPPTPPNLVPRPRLLDILSKGVDKKLTVISAPAGFGKTTLLSEWVNSLSDLCAWITLDESDSALGRFLAYFIEALVRVGNELDDSILAILQSSQTKNPSAFLDPLINQLSISDKNTILVLDDYHLISSEEVHISMDYLIGNQPPNLHIVISGRADPPLSLARLRANGQLVELRAGDLKFTHQEGQKFITETQNINLSKKEINILSEYTEGWIAGLQLAAISLRGKTNKSELIQGLSGNFDYVADYFIDEVLKQQPSHIQEFLLHTSVLNRFNWELCQEFTGQPESSKILKYLRKNNLFLIPMDQEMHWYRYHQLFRDLLNQRLLEANPDILPSLFLKACEWNVEKGFIFEAIEYAFDGKHYERAADLISREVEPMIMRSEISTYIKWIEILPDEILRKYPILSVYYSWALMVNTLQPDKAESHLEGLLFDNPVDESRANTVKSMFALFNRRIQEAVKNASLALENLPASDLFFRSIAAWNLSAALYISGNAVGGEEALNQAIKISRESGNTFILITALCRQGQTHYQLGLLHKPKNSFQQALDLAHKENGIYLPVACEAMLGLGRVFYQWNDLDNATNFITQSIELSRQWRESTTLEGYIGLAKINQARGQIKQANDLLEIAKKISQETTNIETDDLFVNLNQVNLWVLQGDLIPVERWINERRLDSKAFTREESPGEKAVRNYEKLVYARYLVVNNLPQKALQILDDILPELEKINLKKKVLEVLILKAVAHMKNHSYDQSLEDLQTSFKMSIPERHIQIYLDEVQPIKELVTLALEKGIEPDFTQLLLRHFQGESKSSITDGFVKPLSARELEVLRLLDTDLSVPEISEHLFVAVSTIRSHIKSIYSKLEVHSRHEALTRAKELDLL